MKTSEEIMSKKLISVRMEDTMLLAYQLMTDNGIRHLPVFDEQQNLMGILSDRDVQRAMVTDKGDECLEEVYLNIEKKVIEFMSRPIASVQEETPLSEVILLMTSKKISAVMVENRRGKFTGIITTDDLLTCLLNLISREDELMKKPISFFAPNILY